MPEGPEETTITLHEKIVPLSTGGTGNQTLKLTRKATEYTTTIQIFNHWGVISGTIIVDVAGFKDAVRNL